MQKEILTEDMDDIIDPQDQWKYPKNLNNSFDLLIAEEFGTEFPVECKRCGKKFIRKKEKQIFCSRKCVGGYKTKMNEMKEKYGKKFKDWLNDTIDYSYSPSKF